MLDLLIGDALVVDGSGAPPFRGWVGVVGDRVAAVGRSDATMPAAAHRIEAGGAVVAPGFVDVHNHADLSAFVLPEMPSLLRQGVTSVVVGNCGSSPWPLAGYAEAVELAYADPAAHPAPSWEGFGDYLDAVEAARPAVNVAALVGHGAIRRQVLRDERRPPSADELDVMRGFVRDALESGAVGLSTGLIYTPGIHASTDEVVALAEQSTLKGGIYASHIRGEGAHLFRAVDEAIEIGRRAGLPAHVSHLKCESSLVWGRADELLARIHGADDVTADQYPYAAWNSSLSSLLPPWVTPSRLEGAVREPATRERLRTAVEEGEPDFQSSVSGVGWDHIVIVGTADERWRGLDVAAIATHMGFDPFAAFVRLLVEDPSTSCIGHAMHEGDVRTILADPEIFVASDSSATAPWGPGGELPVHPRDYGTFPRVLGRYVRDEGVLDLASAVRKMTSMPAARFGLKDRGVLEPGAFADLCVFDRAEIADTATFEAPHAFASGVRAVVVNGMVAQAEGPVERAGRVLRRG